MVFDGDNIKADILKALNGIDSGNFTFNIRVINPFGPAFICPLFKDGCIGKIKEKTLVDIRYQLIRAHIFALNLRDTDKKSPYIEVNYDDSMFILMESVSTAEKLIAEEFSAWFSEIVDSDKIETGRQGGGVQKNDEGRYICVKNLLVSVPFFNSKNRVKVSLRVTEEIEESDSMTVFGSIQKVYPCYNSSPVAVKESFFGLEDFFCYLKSKDFKLKIQQSIEGS